MRGYIKVFSRGIVSRKGSTSTVKYEWQEEESNSFVLRCCEGDEDVCWTFLFWCFCAHFMMWLCIVAWFYSVYACKSGVFCCH